MKFKDFNRRNVFDEYWSSLVGKKNDSALKTLTASQRDIILGLDWVIVMFGLNLINLRKICSLALKIMNPASNSYKGKNLKCKTGLLNPSVVVAES